jgi:hypothetical protein
MEELENKISFYRLLQDEPIGYKEDLRHKYQKIGGQNFDDIYGSSILIGLLRIGIDGMFENRYKVTEFGKKQIVAFFEFNDYLNN